MKDLIEALNIFLKYRDSPTPTYCEHEELKIFAVTEEEVSDDDRSRLAQLGFLWSDDEDGGHWGSLTYGVA